MELSNKILSDITVYMKYAKYIPELNRRETWEELVTRNKNMHIKKYPKLVDEINAAYKFVGGAAGITPTSTSGAIDRIDYIVQNAAAGYVCLTCNFTANYVA